MSQWIFLMLICNAIALVLGSPNEQTVAAAHEKNGRRSGEGGSCGTCTWDIDSLTLSLASTNCNAERCLTNFGSQSTTEGFKIFDYGLTSVNANTFSAAAGMQSIQKVNLGKNKLRTLPSGLFDKLTNVVEIDISFNPITQLPADIFTKLSSLQRLNLEGTPNLSCRPSLPPGKSVQVSAGANYVTLPNCDGSVTSDTAIVSSGSASGPSTQSPSPASSSPTPAPSQGSSGPSVSQASKPSATPSPTPSSPSPTPSGPSPTPAPEVLVRQEFSKVWCGGKEHSSCAECLTSFNGIATKNRADQVSGCNGQCIWDRETGQCAPEPKFRGSEICGRVQCSSGKAASCNDCGSKCSPSGDCIMSGAPGQSSPCMMADSEPTPSLRYKGKVNKDSSGIADEVALIADYNQMVMQLDMFELVSESTDRQVALFGSEEDEIVSFKISCGENVISFFNKNNPMNGQKGMKKGDNYNFNTADIAKCRVGDDIEIFMEELDATTNDVVTYTIPAWRYASLPASATIRVLISLKRNTLVSAALDLFEKTGISDLCISDFMLGGLGWGAKAVTKVATKGLKTALANKQVTSEALQVISDLQKANKGSGISETIRDKTVSGLAEAAGFLEFGCVSVTEQGRKIANALGLTGTAVYAATLHFDGWEARKSNRRSTDYGDPCAVTSPATRTLKNTCLLLCLCIIVPIMSTLQMAVF